MKTRILIYTIMCCLIGACSSTPKPYKAMPAKTPAVALKVGKGSDAVVAAPLTTDGDNYRPVFSADGKRILFLSENREGHRGMQAYEIDLATRAEKRLTFQDGDIESAVYSKDGQNIFYASSTDEIKEEPQFLSQLTKRLSRGSEEARVNRIAGTLEEREPGPYEIYEASRDGNHIRRLTKSSGFDGDLALAHKGKTLIYSSSRNKQRDLYLMDLATGSSKRLTSEPFRDIEPAISTDGTQLAWARLSEGLTTAHIIIADGNTMVAKPLTIQNAMNIAPAWHPNGQEIVFASDRNGEKNKDGQKSYDLYEVNKSGACLKRLTESENDETFPAFSPDGRQIAFSSNHSGHYQIYLMDHRPPTVCLDQQP